MPFRLVATDLDGTIVRSDGTISQRTVKALARVEESGAAVVLVTGRPPRWIAPVAEATGHRGTVICSNGALLYDLHDEKVLETFAIEASVVAQVVAILSDAIPELAFAIETGNGMYRTRRYTSGWSADPDPEAHVCGVDDLAAHKVAKLLARHPTLSADELLQKAGPIVAHLVETTHSNGRGLMEMSSPGVSKATTLARFAEGLGVGAADVVAFGDMPNDLPMLGWAGTAYAVANAHPLVLQAVRRTTRSNDDDGVAVVLEELFGG